MNRIMLKSWIAAVMVLLLLTGHGNITVYAAEKLSEKTETDAESSMALLSERPHVYTFTSGAGGWMNTLTIYDDWTFSGEYHDSEMGDAGPGYPKGSVYICNYTGKFQEPVQLTSYSFQLSLDTLDLEDAEGSIYLEDEIRYITTMPYGLEDANEFIFYLPGTPLSVLTGDSYGWVSMSLPQTATIIPENMFLLRNSATDAVFIGTPEADSWQVQNGNTEFDPSTC